MIIIPLAGSRIIASVYRILFGVGTMLAMGTLAFFMGKIVASMRTRNILPWFQATAGAVSMFVGLLWIGYGAL